MKRPIRYTFNEILLRKTFTSFTLFHLLHLLYLLYLLYLPAPRYISLIKNVISQ